MANNTNAQAIAFTNNDARRAADEMVTCYLTMKRLVQLWTSQGVAALMPNDTNFVDDGAVPGGTTPGSPDGRPPVTNGQVNILIANANTLIAAFEASGNLLLNQTLQVSVNAQSKLT